MSNLLRTHLFRNFIIILFIGIVAYVFFHFQKNDEIRTVTFFVEYNGFLSTAHTNEENASVEEGLLHAGYVLQPDTNTFPARGNLLLAGTYIKITPAITYAVSDEESAKEFTNPVSTVAEALDQAGVKLEGADFAEPVPEAIINNGTTVQVTRVTVTEETEEAKTPFKRTEEEDGTLSWQTKKIAQKGESGIRSTAYKVSRHNGKIVAKEKITESITKEPVTEKTVIGTKVTVVKKHTGGASWYAHTGTLAAANPWLPFGSYVRVTNTANGKSVIVKINDRGPFGAGRIIDLDKVAFAKIADIGTGIINVLMEEIK